MQHPGADHDYRYAIGIDLGTTNTAVAYVDLTEEADGAAHRPIHLFEVPQLVALSELGHQPVLPSFCYLPGPHDLPAGSTALPWDAERSYVVGELAREQGARVPGRLVASAKSWLSHAAVDRTAPILPWGAPDEVDQISPVEASRRYLQHLREAWNDRLAQGRTTHRFENQLLILTVPASFDEVARELTVRAARSAGLPHVILLEEPLAAFYAWLSDHTAQRGQMQDGQLILVCDVGGGTTDFSIVGVRHGDEGLRFERLAVGDHLMLGGDNMDYTLGRQVEAEIAEGPGKLDVRRWHQLVHQCRRAKERLLGVDAPEEVDVTVTGTGSSLIAGMLQGTLRHDDVEQVILDGFFPEVGLDEPLQEVRRRGLTELGLPYEQDPAITRHLAHFWRRARPYLQEKTGRDVLFPDYVLFNGGVFTPLTLRARVLRIVQRWFEQVAGAGWHPDELHNPRLDLAVATGAAYYGLVRRGEGIRVGSGSARAYYVGVEAAAEATSTEQPAICLVPRGAEEGFVGRLEHMTFEALANHPITFHLYSSTTRSGDALGEVVRLHDDEIVALPPIRTAFQFGKKAVARKVPVQLGVRLTEVGTLELWCDSVHTDHRWQLQFDVRQESDADADAQPVDEALAPEKLGAAQQAIREVFEGNASPGTLWERLEEILDEPRNQWPMPVLRKLADTLLPLPRDGSPEHEVQWFNLLGYCLRPGHGDPVDAWRVDQAWKNYLAGLHFADRLENRIAWWTFWRRLGGGLPMEKQEQVYYDARSYIQLQVQTRKKHPLYPLRMKPQEKMEAWMTLASFERMSIDIKITLGQLLLQAIKQDKPRYPMMWALARLGARHPIYGPHDRIVPPDEVALWLKTIISLPPPRRDHVAYALAQMARRTGERDRELPEEWYQQVYRWLRKMDDEAHYRELLDDDAPAPDHEGQRWLLGEPLPEAGRALLDPHGITVGS